MVSAPFQIFTIISISFESSLLFHHLNEQYAWIFHPSIPQTFFKYIFWSSNYIRLMKDFSIDLLTLHSPAVRWQYSEHLHYYFTIWYAIDSVAWYYKPAPLRVIVGGQSLYLSWKKYSKKRLRQLLRRSAQGQGTFWGALPSTVIFMPCYFYWCHSQPSRIIFIISCSHLATLVGLLAPQCKSSCFTIIIFVPPVHMGCHHSRSWSKLYCDMLFASRFMSLKSNVLIITNSIGGFQ